MRFTAITIMALALPLAVWAVKLPVVPEVVQNLPDGGTVTPELPCNPTNRIDYIEECTAQLDDNNFTFENMEKCMKEAGCPDE